jgi:AcrR family transcriptional regulator
MASLRERKKAATRMAIADAASELFEAHGFAHVSVDAVAAAAGVSRQTVFNYFPTKEDLVFDRADEIRELMVGALRSRGSVSVVETMRALSHAFWTRLAALPEDRPQAGFFAIFDSTPSLQAYARELGSRVIAEMAAVLREQLGHDPDDVRPFVLAAALGAAHTSVLEQVTRRVVAGEAPRTFIPEVLAGLDRAYDLLAEGFGAT